MSRLNSLIRVYKCISLSFLGKLSLKIRSNLFKLITTYFRGCKIKVVFNSGKRLGSFLRFKDVLPLNVRSLLIYKFICSSCNSLPVIVRTDLSFDEYIVVQLKFGRKKYFFTVLYRTPSFNHNSLEFQDFLSNFEHLYSKIRTEIPFAIFFTGDFNAHSQLWWLDGDTTPEGTKIDELFTKLGLSQLISEPTNFELHKNPSCIDLVVTDQPNIILDSGTRVSLDTYCHHQIVHCKVNFRIPLLYHLREKYGILIEQIQMLLNFLDIVWNFVPNETKRFVPRNPLWITKQLKTMLNRKNRLFNNYKRRG